MNSLVFFIQGRVTGEVDELALMSRKSRTQVFSGRKVATAVTSKYTLIFIFVSDDHFSSPFHARRPLYLANFHSLS